MARGGRQAAQSITATCGGARGSGGARPHEGPRSPRRSTCPSKRVPAGSRPIGTVQARRGKDGTNSVRRPAHRFRGGAGTGGSSSGWRGFLMANASASASNPKQFRASAAIQTPSGPAGRRGCAARGSPAGARRSWRRPQARRVSPKLPPVPGGTLSAALGDARTTQAGPAGGLRPGCAAAGPPVSWGGARRSRMDGVPRATARLARARATGVLRTRPRPMRSSRICVP